MKANYTRIFDLSIRFIVTSLAVIGALAIYIYLHRVPDKQDKEFEHKILLAFDKGTPHVFVKDLYPNEWKMMCPISPYDTPLRALWGFGIGKKGEQISFTRSNSQFEEDEWGFLFLDAQNNGHYFKFKSHRIRGRSGDIRKCPSPSEAVFKVKFIHGNHLRPELILTTTDGD